MSSYENPSFGGVLEVLTKEEYNEKYKDLVNRNVMIRSMENLNHCKADVFKDYVIGTFYVPDRNDLTEKEWACGFYMDRKKLIFIGDTENISRTIRKINENQMIEPTSPARILFEFLEMIIYDDMEFINLYEENLSSRELEMTEYTTVIPRNFDRYILNTRRELTVLHRYYRQLYEMGNALKDCPNGLYSEADKALFNFFIERVGRFFSDIQGLKEYVLHISNMYQSRIDIKQNKIMQILTIITTIFMPLTLIAGWYGMNFKNMPELRWNYGYVCVIVLSVMMIIIEFIIFKIKKWL